MHLISYLGDGTDDVPAAPDELTSTHVAGVLVTPDRELRSATLNI